MKKIEILSEATICQSHHFLKNLRFYSSGEATHVWEKSQIWENLSVGGPEARYLLGGKHSHKDIALSDTVKHDCSVFLTTRVIWTRRCFQVAKQIFSITFSLSTHVILMFSPFSPFMIVKIRVVFSPKLITDLLLSLEYACRFFKK